ncbi:MAG: hypothetical protein OXG74_16735 [Acidobacteria bacterium]|nr:hypothetical protein [Acidobacteriota bacterium]
MSAHTMLRGAYSVSAVATTPDGHQHESQGITVNESVALQYFFDKDNPEMLFKLLDACAVNGHRWVFMAAITDLAVRVAVTESQTGTTRTYESGPGPFQPISDVEAFPCLDA